jgi:hypothetical protein
MTSKTKKQYIYLLLFAILIVAGAIFLIKNNDVLGFLKPSIGSEAGRSDPAYLSGSIPDLSKIQSVLNDSKFKEMKYLKSFFTSVIVDKKGRPNPFVPIVSDKEELPKK